jgi:hypothetical protein
MKNIIVISMLFMSISAFSALTPRSSLFRDEQFGRLAMKVEASDGLIGLSAQGINGFTKVGATTQQMPQPTPTSSSMPGATVKTSVAWINVFSSVCAGVTALYNMGFAIRQFNALAANQLKKQ